MTRKATLFVLAAVLSLALAAPAFAAPPGERISNELTSEITATTEEPTITVAALDTTPPVTLTDDFTVSTTRGSVPENTMVRVKVTLTGEPTGLALEYLEVQNSTWYPLPFDQTNVAWYGPEAGFPLADATSQFKVTWKKMGTYTANLEVIKVSDNAVLASTSVTVDVRQALTVGWSLPDTVAVTTNQSFQVTTSATKDSELGQAAVERVLYVIEVTKDNQVVGSDVVTAVAEGGQALGYDNAGFFYWGPRSGFTFTEASLSTTFTVTIKQDGTYNVKAYAVQLP